MHWVATCSHGSSLVAILEVAEARVPGHDGLRGSHCMQTETTGHIGLPNGVLLILGSPWA